MKLGGWGGGQQLEGRGERWMKITRDKGKQCQAKALSSTFYRHVDKRLGGYGAVKDGRMGSCTDG